MENAYLSVSLIIIGICYHLAGSLLHTLISNAKSWKMRAHLMASSGLFANLLCLIINTISLDQELSEYEVAPSWKDQITLWYMIFNLCACICTFCVMVVRMEQQYNVILVV